METVIRVLSTPLRGVEKTVITVLRNLLSRLCQICDKGFAEKHTSILSNTLRVFSLPIAVRARKKRKESRITTAKCAEAREKGRGIMFRVFGAFGGLFELKQNVRVRVEGDSRS